MITAVDTSVLIDVFGADVRFGQSSAVALRRCLNEGAVVACAAVWAETRAAFASDEAFVQAMNALEIGYSLTTEQSAVLAGRTCKKYRAAGGKRDRMIADFLIGAHASCQCERLLTRDRGYYQQYFTGLHVLNPSA